MIELVPWLSKPAAGSSKQELPSQVGNWRLFLLAAADELYFLVWVCSALLFFAQKADKGAITIIEINLER